jgi:uncharacterized protein (TIGR03083 family)
MDWRWVGPPLDVRTLFPVDRAELLGLLRSLDPPAWRRPTVCPGWRVHDVVAHLVHDHIRRLSGTRDVHTPGIRPGEDLPGFLARVNQEFVEVARRWSPAVLIELCADLGPRLDRVWAGLDLHRIYDNDVSWAAPGVPAPAWLDVAREYTEYWVHQQQIRDAVGRPGANGPELLGPVVDTFLRALPRAFHRVDCADGAAVAVEITGAGGGAWTVTRVGGGWWVTRGSDPRAVARVALSSDTLWRLATRGITVEHARTLATLAGEPALAAAALTLVSIIR